MTRKKTGCQVTARTAKENICGNTTKFVWSQISVMTVENHGPKDAYGSALVARKNEIRQIKNMNGIGPSWAFAGNAVKIL